MLFLNSKLGHLDCALLGIGVFYDELSGFVFVSFIVKTYLEAAKTHFTKNYKALNPNKITSTVGLNIGVINTDGCSLNFWDLGGQEELQSLWDKVTINTHGF